MHYVTFGLLIIGGLNWLLQGLFGWEVGQLFGGMDAVISRVIYALVGLAAVWELVGHKKSCKLCAVKGGSATPPTAPSV